MEASRRWGPANAAINWCERDYDTSPLVAEFWNTVSNAIFVFFGLLALSVAKRHNLPGIYKWSATAFILTGIFSAYFHATLWWSGQRLDEIFETSLLISLYHSLGLNPKFIQVFLHTVPVAVCIVVLSAWLFCELHLGGLAVAVAIRFNNATNGSTLRHHVWRVALLAVFGFACWVVDRTACTFMYERLPFNPQLHAWWHVVMAVVLWEAFIVSAALRQTKTKPQVVSYCGLSTLPEHYTCDKDVVC
eukprot:TRINITY_DN68010_c4_g1_i1.p1 TRINITY_DN68010_c4_g1~~TRINITY_DN68010_c4_g1_i1.p1  ORF type:complete len:247 (-),score=8.09 TRINITY_DN68010_c4_g1_i1:118-858(-)